MKRKPKVTNIHVLVTLDNGNTHQVVLTELQLETIINVLTLQKISLIEDPLTLITEKPKSK